MEDNGSYQRVKSMIESSRWTGMQKFFLNSMEITEIPESIGELISLTSLDISNNKLRAIPIQLGNLTQLENLYCGNNMIEELPASLQYLTKLEIFVLENNEISILPAWIGKLNTLQVLKSSKNKINHLPESVSELINLTTLDFSNNQLKTLPTSIGRLEKLIHMDLSGNLIDSIPEIFEKLTQIFSLNLSENRITSLPSSIKSLKQLREINISSNQLENIPEEILNLDQLEILNLAKNKLTSLPEEIQFLTNLTRIDLSNNQIADIPATLTNIQRLNSINLDGNPLNPELSAAYKLGFRAIKDYLSAKIESITLNEAKLIIVGEGEVGKTCLVDALSNEDWQEHNSTHGIQIKPITLSEFQTDKKITLNAWDFGGQRVYRPTHQLFFSAPAVYLVVWKPREGSQAGQVKEWIQLIKRREPAAKILVVATHGGPQQRQPDIDQQEIWDLFSKETVVDFFFVDSKPNKDGLRKGIEELRRAIAQIAFQLPEVGRSVPKSFVDARQALKEKGVPYLSISEVFEICYSFKMNHQIAKLFISISNYLGHLTYYENDPKLNNIVILRPDWLSTAMSYVLDDEETRNKHGLINFSRLSYLWNDPARPIENRYPKELHPIFMRLMERFDLSYRVADPYSKNDDDPISLIGQLVSSTRPGSINNAWGLSPSDGDIQQVQICNIVDANNGKPPRFDEAEGLFYQLIVRLHKYSLGRNDYKESVHWQRGLVLEDEYKSRAFLEHIGNDVRITVRSPFPEGLLSTLTREVKYLVESFWKGLRCDVMVPCIEPCGKQMPGTGMFEVEKLMDSKRKKRAEFPCPVCTEWQNIDTLLRNAPAASQTISITELQSEFTAIKDKLDENNVLTRRVLSQVEKTYTDLLQVLTDEAREGPRLFSFSPVDRSNFNPKEWIREKFHLVLWCEHSRLPLTLLNGKDSKRGVYEIEMEREWFKKSVPYLRLLTTTLGLVLPVASSALKVIDNSALKTLENQIDFGKDVVDAIAGEAIAVGKFMGSTTSTNLDKGSSIRADGSTLRELHALLKSKDPGFGGLIRVMNKRQEFLWVHERFAGEY